MTPSDISDNNETNAANEANATGIPLSLSLSLSLSVCLYLSLRHMHAGFPMYFYSIQSSVRYLGLARDIWHSKA